MDQNEHAEATPSLSSHILELPLSLKKPHHRHHILPLQAHQSLDFQPISHTTQMPSIKMEVQLNDYAEVNRTLNYTQ